MGLLECVHFFRTPFPEVLVVQHVVFALLSRPPFFFPRPYLGLGTPAFSLQARASVGVFIFVVACRENVSSSSGDYSFSLFVFMEELKNIPFLFCVALYSFLCVCCCFCFVVRLFLIFSFVDLLIYVFIDLFCDAFVTHKSIISDRQQKQPMLHLWLI